MEKKKWYKSKTLWVNVIALVVLFAGAQFGFEVTGEESGATLVIINLIMRIVTKSGLY